MCYLYCIIRLFIFGFFILSVVELDLVLLFCVLRRNMELELFEKYVFCRRGYSLYVYLDLCIFMFIIFLD